MSLSFQDPGASSIVAEFRRRWLRQIVAAVLAFAPLGFAGRPTSDPVWVLGLPRFVWVLMGLITLPALYFFTKRNWRCPACGEAPGRHWRPLYCDHCGARLLERRVKGGTGLVTREEWLQQMDQRDRQGERLEEGERAELGVVLLLGSTVFFGILGEIGGAFSRAMAEGRIGLGGLWGCRLLGLSLFLLGGWLLRRTHRGYLALGMTRAEVRKMEWAWAVGLGLGMMVAGAGGLIWLVDGFDFSQGWHVQLSETRRAFPMAVAFAVYGVAGVVLFIVGAVLHLRVPTGGNKK